MALLSKKTSIPAESDALPGRNTPLPLSGRHFVNGSRIKQPATGGLEEAFYLSGGLLTVALILSQLVRRPLTTGETTTPKGDAP